MSGKRTGWIAGIILVISVFMFARNGTFRVYAAETNQTEKMETEVSTEEIVQEETDSLEKKSDDIESVVSGEFRVYNVTAKSIHKLQSVLTKAAEEATEKCPSKVIIEPGMYTLSKTLRISSNTYLSMKGVTFLQKRGVTGNMLKIGIDTGHEWGYCYKNITLYGGTWNKNGNSGSSVIKVGHAANFSMDGVKVINVVNGHLMEAAGINGFYIQKCAFMNQTNDMATLGSTVPVYEAIQFDILEVTHMKGYTSEDLKNKNIVVENSTFQNVPRGVGNHTSILNNPTENVRIENNLFENITDVAIRGEGYINIKIRNNEIRRSQNGIMILSLRNYGGTYLGSTLASEGKTTAVSPSYYCVPVKNQKIVIENNTIICNNNHVEGEYYGILIQGVNYTKDQKIAGKDTIPEGDYFISGVKIINNHVEATQYGITLLNTKNAVVSSNRINSRHIQNGHGVYLAQSSKECKITSNTISGFSGSGICLEQNSYAESISNNRIRTTGEYGIGVQGGAVDKIVSNTVAQTGNKGIVVYDNVKVGKIEKNMVRYCRGYGITVGSIRKAVAIQNNTVMECNDKQIYVDPGSTKYTVTIAKNRLKGMSSGSGIRADSGDVKISSNIIDTNGVGVYLYAQTKGIIEENTYNNITMYQIYIVNQYNDKEKNKYSNLAKPVVLKTIAKSEKSIQLMWENVKGAKGYEIYRCGSKNGTYKKIATVSGKTRKKTGAYTDVKLNKNKRYYYKILPYTKSFNGKVKIQGTCSKVISIKTKKK